jgi:transposase
VAKPAIEVSTDPGALLPGVDGPPSPAAPPGRAPTASACAPYRELIEAALARGRDAMAIWRDLVDDHGFPAQYASVRRFVLTLRGARPVEAHPVIVTAPGEEGQVDYGDGPMVRHPVTRKYRRTRLFVFTLGYSRKSVRLLTFQSSTRRWAELHEETCRRLGGAVRVVVLDNLREGVLQPDIYDPTLNPLYRDVLAHYGAVALPCRVADPDRKPRVERGIPYVREDFFRGEVFRDLEDMQARARRWCRDLAGTRIHGTTRRVPRVVFETEEQPVLLPLGPEPLNRPTWAQCTAHPDHHIQFRRAIYSVPTGYIGAAVDVRGDSRLVRIYLRGELIKVHPPQPSSAAKAWCPRPRGATSTRSRTSATASPWP